MITLKNPTLIRKDFRRATLSPSAAKAIVSCVVRNLCQTGVVSGRVDKFLPVLMLLMLHDSISVGRIVIERVVATGTDRSTACNSSSHAAAPELLPRRNVNDVAVVITDPDRPQRNELRDDAGVTPCS